MDNNELSIDDKASITSNNIFPFETEAMVIKSNSDFTKLQQCLILLESQRTQTLKDIDKLMELQDEALADPFEFTRKVEKGEDLGIPLRMNIPDVPEIDWSKYKVQVPLDAIRPFTRPKPQRCDKTDSLMVRGRVPTKSKSTTFNKHWTVEEQLKLEELLMKYPPGDNEARRFAKIAEELGTRTLSQVTSRCQKYFLKLQKAGLPVPGRAPRAKTYEMLRGSKNLKSTPIYQQSTFFPKMFPPVNLREDGDLPGTSSLELPRIKEEPIDLDYDDDISEDVKHTDEFRKLMLIRRVKRNVELYGGNDRVGHQGYRCDICQEDPLTGTRWHCVDCDDVDLCSGCLITQLEGDRPHDLTHNWAAYRPANPMGDYDYSSHGNYLDPNFHPE